MAKVGRPTVMTPQTVSKLEEGFSMGFTDEEACLYADISKPALYDYCKLHPEFSDRKEELKRHPTLLAKRNVLEGLKDGDQKMSQWYLERKAPDFKAKAEITSKQIDLSSLSEQQLERIANGEPIEAVIANPTD